MGRIEDFIELRSARFITADSSPFHPPNPARGNVVKRQLSVMAYVFVVFAHEPNVFDNGLNTAVPSQPPTTEIAKMLKGFRTTVRGSPARPK
jgi:hypothetical protein